jgi:hypothetical protein
MRWRTVLVKNDYDREILSTNGSTEWIRESSRRAGCCCSGITQLEKWTYPKPRDESRNRKHFALFEIVRILSAPALWGTVLDKNHAESSLTIS